MNLVSNALQSKLCIERHFGLLLGAGACRLAYDLVRCGDGWCGIEVKDGKECGRTAMDFFTTTASQMRCSCDGHAHAAPVPESI